ncbi:superoxide dismutase family protein [Phenylobacterium sp.]|uniref:superoxide dismutase family protein n=1 Tax=Phenylobacterium sp. TaxID=1871053 RepID=UPI003983A0FE
MIKLLAVAATTALLLGVAAQAQDRPKASIAILKDSVGKEVGGVMLVDAPKGVVLRISAKGLTPGWHGLHFHEKGDCSKADFTSAGAHTHGAAKAVHGLLNPAANETGDLPNLYIGADGAGMGEFYSGLTSVGALKDADGSAVVIHAGADDHMSQPIGGSGARVACAVIR